MLHIDYAPFTLNFSGGLSDVIALNNADGFNLYAIATASTATGVLGVETAAVNNQPGTWPEDTTLSFTGGADGEFHKTVEAPANFVRIRLKSGSSVTVKLQRWRKGGN